MEYLIACSCAQWICQAVRDAATARDVIDDIRGLAVVQERLISQVWGRRPTYVSCKNGGKGSELEIDVSTRPAAKRCGTCAV